MAIMHLQTQMAKIRSNIRPLSDGGETGLDGMMGVAARSRVIKDLHLGEYIPLHITHTRSPVFIFTMLGLYAQNIVQGMDLLPKIKYHLGHNELMAFDITLYR